MKKKFFRNIAHYLPQCFLLISVLTSNVLFPVMVLAQEIEDTNSISQEKTAPIDTSEDILEEGISTSIYEEEEAVEQPFVFENGIYTVNKVIQDEEYVYPENENVRVKFTEVTQEGNLVIKRVELTEEQKELLNTKDNYGWDITSSMENGTFKYNLTLPNTQGNEDIEVKYTEDGNTYENIDDSNVEIKSNVVTIEGLDHFTVFVVSEVKRATYWDWANRTKQWTIEYEVDGLAQYVENPTGDVLLKGREIGLGSDYILTERPGTGRAYLGYDGFDSTLYDSNGPTLSQTLIKEISWQSYSAKSLNDHYLNIYLFKPKFLGFDYATIVYVPSVGTANAWNTYSTDSPGTLCVKKGNECISYHSMSALINAYGSWRIRPDNSTGSGITIVSGSSNSGPEIENYIDNVKIYYTNGEVDTYTFENSTDSTPPNPTFSTTISSPTNQTPIPVNLAFNEDVYELKDNDLAFTNATISSFTKVSQSQYQININPVNSGEVIISIPQGAVFDATGNPNVSASLTITYETVAPTSNISIQADLNETPDLTHNNGWHGGGWYYNFDKILLSIDNPEPGDFIQYQIKDENPDNPGSSWTSADSNWIDLAQTINEKGDGVYTIFWYAEDLAGNKETLQREVVKIDRTNPTYTIDFDSINGRKNNNVMYIKDNKIQINVNVEDSLSGYTRARYDLYTADGNWNCTYESTNEDNLVPAAESTNRALSVSGLSDGRYCLKIWVYDDVQNNAFVDTNGKQWVHFIIDNTAPSAPTLTGDPIQYVKWGNVTRTWSPSSSNDVAYYMYKNITNEWTSGPYDAGLEEYSITHNTGNYDRIFEWKVSAVDYAGNETWSKDTYKVVVDGTKPSIEIVSPQTDNSYQNSTFDVIVTAEDTNSGLNKVVVHIYDESNTIVENCDVSSLRGTSTYTVTCNMNTTEHSDGIYTIKTNAYDLAGNMSQTLSRSFTIDTTAPEVEVTSHNDGDFVHGTVTITGKISDTNLSHYWFVVVDSNGTQVAGPGTVPSNDENITASFTWDTTNNVTDGEYIIKLEAKDLAGNKDPNKAPVLKDPEKEGDSVDWVTITVDNTHPEVLFADQVVSEILTGLPSYQITSKSEDLLGDPVCAIDEGITFPIDAESENNPFTVSCTYSDLAGNKNTSTYKVTVTNVPVEFTLSATKTKITQGDDDIALETNITNGNSPYTYLWSEDCTGTGSTTIFSGDNNPDNYICTVTVTDADGDTASSSTSIEVIAQPVPAQLPAITEGAVLGVATTTTTPTIKRIINTASPIYTTQSTQSLPTQIEETLETTSIEEETSVLGEKCENNKKVSGYVYIDKNKDNQMNENEEGIKDITLTIQYTDEEGNIKTEEEVSTDEKGYWETQLCSGKYNIVVKEDTLPKNIEVPEVLSLTVSDNEKETIFNIQALDTRNFWQKYWYLIVGGLAIIAIGYTSIKNRKKEEI